jgi:membrane-bound metal-dependent hydrolase YbcI (DUF457 family)
MPSPVGHALSGLVAGLAVSQRKKKVCRIMLGFVFLTVLPDFDFLPGWLAGQPNLFHRGFSHSLLMAVIIGVTVGLVVKASGRGKFMPSAVAGFSLYALHIVLDLFSVDHSVPRGFQVLWPFDSGYYIAPYGLFLDITRSPTGDGFFQSLFNSNNYRAIINEVVVFLPALLMLWGLRGRMDRISGSLYKADTCRDHRGEGIGTIAGLRGIKG